MPEATARADSLITDNRQPITASSAHLFGLLPEDLATHLRENGVTVRDAVSVIAPLSSRLFEPMKGFVAPSVPMLAIAFTSLRSVDAETMTPFQPTVAAPNV